MAFSKTISGFISFRSINFDIRVAHHFHEPLAALAQKHRETPRTLRACCLRETGSIAPAGIGFDLIHQLLHQLRWKFLS